MKKLLLIVLTGFQCLSVAQSTTETAIDTVDQMYNYFCKYGDGNDPESLSNKSKMKKSLELLKNNPCDSSEFGLLIAVWLNYSPLHFKTRELVEPILFKNKKATLEAIDDRINKIKIANVNYYETYKRKYEKGDHDKDCSDLLNLKKRLK